MGRGAKPLIPRRLRTIVGVGMVIYGLPGLIDDGLWWRDNADALWPIALVAAGLVLATVDLWSRRCAIARPFLPRKSWPETFRPGAIECRACCEDMGARVLGSHEQDVIRRALWPSTRERLATERDSPPR